MCESRNTGPQDGLFDNLEQPPAADPTHGVRPKSRSEARWSSLPSFGRLPRSVIEQ